MINSFDKQSNEIMEINNILYTVMPSDISLFSDNAIQEDVHFRSRGAFAFRSKKSKSKIILTFPIPLLDPGTQEKYSEEERELFDNGLKLISQLNSYPFCFVRSSRIYSYLGVSFNTPRDYLMFGVEELKVVQDLRVPGVLFAEVTLLFHNHMNLIKDFSFYKNLSFIKKEKSFGTATTSHAHESEVFNNFMDAISGDSLLSYSNLIKELGIRESNSNFEPASLLSNIILKVPYIAGADEMVISDTKDNIVLDIRDTDLKSIEYTDFKMYDRFTAAENTFDGGTLQDFQGSEEQDMEFLRAPDNFLYDWRAYYLKDKFMFDPNINSIQSLTLSKKNIFASHHLGSSQHPYLQFMGKVPARMSISSVYNSTGSYEYNQKSTFNLFRLMLNSIDTNNTLYPGANVVNFIKIKSVVNNVLGIHNFIPGECALSSTSDTSNIESFQTTFIENSMDALSEESKIKSGKNIVNSEVMQRTSKVLSDYYYSLQRELKGKEDVDYDFALSLLSEASRLKIRLDAEKVGGRDTKVEKQVTEDGKNVVSEEELVTVKTGEKFVSRKDGGSGLQGMTKKVAENSGEYFKYVIEQGKKENPKTEEEKRKLLKKIIPLLPIVISDLDIRESLNNYNNGESKDFKGSDIYYQQAGEDGKKGNIQRLDETYVFDIVANNLISAIYQTLVSRTEIGRESLKDISGKELSDSLSNANDMWLNSFVGDAQRDLNFEKYREDVNVRKYLDPFFFLYTEPQVKKLDFMEASQLLNGAAFDNLKNYINREITEGGVLDGGSAHAHELFADLEALQEKRYAPIDEAGERRAKQEANSGIGGGVLGVSGIGKLGDYKNKPLGFVSSTYEGRVESANKDNRGWAYGKYQFNNVSGGLDKFFSLAPEYKKQFAGLTSGTTAFNNKWVYLATHDRENFEKAQDKAAKKGWFDEKIAEVPGGSSIFKVNNRGVQEAIFSASIQHGAVVKGILIPVSKIPGFKDMAADTQVKEIYKQRMKYYWSLNSPDVVALRPAMKKRYASEVVMAMEIAQGGISNVGSSGLSEPVPKASDNYNVSKTPTRTKSDTSPKVKTQTAAAKNQTNQSNSKGGGKFKGKPKVNQTLKVKVHTIVDTDTIVVSNSTVNDGEKFTIRVLGIDAPEARKNNKNLNQWWAAESVAALKQYVQEGGSMKIVTKDKDAYGRVLANIYKLDNTDIAKELIAGGHTLRSPTNTGAINAQANAKAKGLGMWSKPDKVVTPDAFRKAHNISKEETDPVKAQSKSPDVSLEQTRKESIKAQFNEKATNNLVPLDPKYKDYQITSGFGWRTRSNKTVQFHKGIDITRKAGPGKIKGTAVIAPTSGIAFKKTDSNGGGRYVELVTDAQGFTCKFLHLENWAPIFNGKDSQGVVVSKGDVLGYVGNSGMNTPGKNFHLHYTVEYDGVDLDPWYTSDLDTLPKKQAFNAGAYIHPKAFHSHRQHARQGLNPDPRTEALVLKILGGQALAINSEVASNYSDQYTPEQIRGYSIISPDILPSVSVYDDTLKLEKHMGKMFSNFECGLNISFPVIKGYITVGNEDDEFYFKGTTLKTATYFELPSIQEFHLSTNNDFNPIDVCTFSLINPNSIASIPEDFGLDGSGRKVENIDTQYYSIFYKQRLQLRPGMKVHIKAGYSNNPNKLHTIFNGSVKEVSGRFESKMNLICESYGTELINNTIGFEKPVDMSKRKNASTGLLIGYALLEQNINHFGAQLGKVRAWSEWVGSLIPSWTNETVYEKGSFFDGKEDNLLAGKGRAGDFRDPENKALVSPFNMGEFLWNAWNPSRANLSQRLYTNIYSDAIEAAHDQYKSTFWARYKNLISWDSEVFYAYWAFRSNTWSIIKEMEYRHPGTLAKPLWYEERQSMFFGTKEQLYVARDLDPKFMFNAGEAVRYTDLTKPFVSSYMQERPKRLEPATGFHLLSSKLNIIDNNMGWSRDFSTRINVIYYEDEYEGNMVSSDSATEVIDIDKGLKPFEIRDKTIALNGCHEKYLAWLYGIQELKKQAEMMYTGTITVTGKPDMRAGDYAYIEDSDRGLSGVIKIRECEHHYSQTSGYITTITPGLFVECTQFLWDTFFIQMGMASKITLIKSDLSVNNTLTSNQLAQDYLEYLKVIQDVKDTSASDKFFGVAGSATVASVIPFLVRNMLKNSTIFGAEPLGKAFKFAGSLLKDLGVYSNDVARARIAATNAKKVEVFAKMKLKYYKVVADLNGTIVSNIKNATKVDKALIRAAKAAATVFKMTRKLPVATTKLLTTRTSITVIGSIFQVAKGVKTLFMANPIGFIIGMVLEMCVGFVMSKLRKLELTHNPLLLFPVNYNGKPYVTGISGFTNSGILETIVNNLRNNIKELRKASMALDTASEGKSLVAASGVVGLNSIASAESSFVSVAEGLSSFLGS